MNPLLFPFLLILYIEGSSCPVTRKVSRLVLYSYLTTLVVTMYAPTLMCAYLLMLVVHTFYHILCIDMCQKLSSKLIFFTLLLCIWWVDMSIILGTMKYDLTIFGYSLLEYSHYLFRELTILAISLCTNNPLVDTRKNIRENILCLIAFILIIIEKQL